jgi:hypothetical protein
MLLKKRAEDQKEHTMDRSTALALCTIALSYIAPAAAVAQDAPPPYQADPSVYKIIYEDQYFRVVAANWKAGTADKPHSHLVPSVIYTITDCALKLTSKDGDIITLNISAGTALPGRIYGSISTENIGSKDCQEIYVERK